mmetsp:Transcript_24110/g.27814  ORF Transcript_24110/g.27814 Transcript_24110/m.27814 type:complete len:136 (+) Transcript_24110:515-922(+)
MYNDCNPKALQANNTKLRSKVMATMKQLKIIQRTIELKEQKCDELEKIIAKDKHTQAVSMSNSRLTSMSHTQRKSNMFLEELDPEKQELVKVIYNEMIEGKSGEFTKQLKQLRSNIARFSPNRKKIRRKIIGLRK